MSENESSENELKPEPVKTVEEGVIIPFIRDLRARLPKSEIEQHLWITKSGLFVRTEYQMNILETFRDFYKVQTNTEISIEKAGRKLFQDFHPEGFFLLIGHSIVVGSLIPCKTTELRGIGIRLYEGIPLDAATSIHQSDEVFANTPNLKAKLSRSGFVAEIATKNQVFEIPFDKIAPICQAFRNSRDLSKYLDTSTLRSFIKTFVGSLSRAKPFDVNFFTILPNDVLHEKNTDWLRIGDSLLVTRDQQILFIVPLKGRGHEEMIRTELALLVKAIGRKRFAGASLNLRKDSFAADYDIQGIAHHFGVSAIFSFLDGVVNYHREFGKYPGRLGKIASVDDVIKCFTWILKDAQPILATKLPAGIKEHIKDDISSCITTAGEWFFGVDKIKMIRQVWFQPKEEKKVVVPLKMPEKQNENNEKA